MKRFYGMLLSIAFMMFTFSSSYAQMPDSSFDSDGENGPLPNQFTFFGGEQQSMALQSDGKIIQAGYIMAEDGTPIFAAVRLNSDGTLDNSFGVLGTKAILFENSSRATVVAIQPDGKILIAGYTGFFEEHEHSSDPKFDIVVVRLEANSALDLSFGVKTFHFGGDFSYFNKPTSIFVQQNGKIIIGGHGGNQGTPEGALLMRLNSDGTFDESFSDDGYILRTDLVFESVNSCAVQSDGKILALFGENFTGSSNQLTRYNSDGSVDNGFGTNGTTPIEVLSYTRGNSLAIQPDGKIIVVGSTYVFTPNDNTGLAFWLISRLNTNGSFDNSFGSSGKKAISFGTVPFPTDIEAHSVAILSSNKIVVVGNAYNSVQNKTNVGVVRLTNAGALDDNFGANGIYLFRPTPGPDISSGGMSLQPDGKLLFSSIRTFNNGADWFGYVNRLLLIRAPKISCPSNITVSQDANKCSAVVNFSATATGDPIPTTTYKIGGTTITSPHEFPVGVTTVDVTAANGISPDASCSFTVTVTDNTPPTVTNVSVNPSQLSPPNHTMQNVTVNYTVVDDCQTSATLSVTSSEPVNGVADGDTDPDWIVVDAHHVQLRAERSANGDGRIYTIQISVTDASGNTSAQTVEVHVAHNIRTPSSGHPFRVGSLVDFSGDFWDKPANKHTSKWLIDGSTSVKGTITEPTTTKNGKATGSYKFTTAGVYKLQMNVIDQNNVTTYANTNGDLEEIVVIYDPNGGYTYGGGWFNSQAGALVSDPTATGKASYGFTVNYFKSSTYPKGETQFEFKVGSLEFNALNFDYLVINGARAQFKGTGKITGDQSGYGFIMTVIDGDLNGTGVDKIRMKIFNKNNGRVVYDNLPGASDADNPTTAVGDNSSVVVYNTTQTLTTTAETTEVLQLDVKAIPNPSNSNFTFTIRSNDLVNPVEMQVVDMYGRLIEKRNVAANSILTLGDKYSTGVYIVTVIQNKIQKQLRLVKTAGKVY